MWEKKVISCLARCATRASEILWQPLSSCPLYTTRWHRAERPARPVICNLHHLVRQQVQATEALPEVLRKAWGHLVNRRNPKTVRSLTCICERLTELTVSHSSFNPKNLIRLLFLYPSSGGLAVCIANQASGTVVPEEPAEQSDKPDTSVPQPCTVWAATEEHALSNSDDNDDKRFQNFKREC